jgi:hypothetical protein
LAEKLTDGKQSRSAAGQENKMARIFQDKGAGVRALEKIIKRDAPLLLKVAGLLECGKRDGKRNGIGAHEAVLPGIAPVKIKHFVAERDVPVKKPFTVGQFKKSFNDFVILSCRRFPVHIPLLYQIRKPGFDG